MTGALSELIGRLEKAEGPSRELDAAIADALGIAVDEDVGCFLPRFTGSLDDVASLISEGWTWLARTHDGSEVVDRCRGDAQGGGCHGFANVNAGTHDCAFHIAFAATAPLALCIAALKARARHEGGA